MVQKGGYGIFMRYRRSLASRWVEFEFLQSRGITQSENI